MAFCAGHECLAPPFRHEPCPFGLSRSGLPEIGELADLVNCHVGRPPNGLALGRFSVIYATPPCAITPRSPVQGSRAVPEHLCLTRPYVPKARTLGRPPADLAFSPEQPQGQLLAGIGNPFRDEVGYDRL